MMIFHTGVLTTFSAESAREWMKLLGNCVATVLPLPDQPGSNARPVRIAILDTGAFIPQDVLTDLYDNRLKECRTWLDSWDDEGKLIDAKSDDDGHGTHGTSVLLSATAETDIEVYVAQVFGSRADQVQRDRFFPDRSVWAVQKVNAPKKIDQYSANNLRRYITQ